METYKIKIYKLAKQDMREIVDYLNTLSPQVADKYYNLFVDKIQSLSQSPTRCALLRDTHLRSRGYRALIIDNYIVFYVIKNDTVQIRRILYGKRHYGSIL